MKRAKGYNLTSARFTKINMKPTLIYRNKIYNVINQKSKFFYNCYISKVTSRGNMETIWSNKFGFPNSDVVWRSIYTQKVININIIKLAEFNHKLLHNILPCGNILHKWQYNISDRCKQCNIIETTEHMLFNCKRVNDIWKLISRCLKVNIQWKTIVCGFIASEQSKHIEFLNVSISCIAYTMFKYNNKEKWNPDEHTCNLNKYIVRNLTFYKLHFKQKKIGIFCSKKFENVI